VKLTLPSFGFLSQQGHPVHYWPGSNILQANAGGDDADYFDSLCATEPDALKDIILTRLNELFDIYSDEEITLEDDIVCTWWSASDSFRGAWFQYGETATLADYQRLFERQGNLLFSGEANCRRYYGFYHGALLAGWRDANIVLDEINALYNDGPCNGGPCNVAHEERCEALPENNGNAVPRSRRFRGGGN